MADSKDMGSSMQVEPEDFILSLAPSDTEDDRQNIITNEVPDSLPAELDNADMTELANNPSLWLDGLEGALASTEVSSMSNVPVMMEEQIEIAHQVSLMDDKDADTLKEVPEASTELEAVEEMEVDDQVPELGTISECTVQHDTHSYSLPQTSFQIDTKTQQNLAEKKVVAMSVPPKTVTVQQVARQENSNPPQITKVVLAPQSSSSSGQPIVFTIPQSSAGMQSLFSSNANIRFVNASSGAKLTTSLAGATQSQPLRVMSPQKTITLQQAQHLGLISPRKGQPMVVNKLSLAGTTATTSLLTNKPTVKLAGGNVTLVRTVPAKTPTKIAPAPPSTTPVATTAQPPMTSLVIKGGAGQMTMGSVVQARAHNTTLAQPASPQKFVLRPATPVSVASNQVRPSSQASQPAQYIRLTTAQAVAAGIIPPTSNQGDSTTPQSLTLAGNKIQLVRVVTPTSGASGNGGNNVVTVGNRLLLGSAAGIKVATSGQVQQQAGKPIFATVSKPAVAIKNTTITTSAAGPQRIILPAGSVGTLAGNVVVLPASQSIQTTSTSVPQPTQATASSLQTSETITTDAASPPVVNTTPLQLRTAPAAKIAQQPSPDQAPTSQSSKAQSVLESNGLKPRKPCNCTKSQCLKLYCDCFANGEFCHGCNCVCCANNLEHEELRLRAIRSCLDRNPHAFKPKIGVGWGPEPRRHNKGCHCKRSGCLKNYCECYEAKIACSAICKCVGCKNCTDPIGSPTPQEKKSLKLPAATTPVNVPIETRPSLPQSKPEDRVDHKNSAVPLMSASSRPPFSFITQEVVEATCQCLLAQAEEAERQCKSTVETEGLVLEEFGRCLLQIIEYASKAKVSASP